MYIAEIKHDIWRTSHAPNAPRLSLYLLSRVSVAQDSCDWFKETSQSVFPPTAE